jgi:hypothetical protein
MQTLRKRPTYNEVVNYLENDQPKIKYPNRVASFMRNSPYLSQFDGDSSFIDLEEQENNIAKQKLLEEEVRRLVAEKGLTAQMLRTGRSTPMSDFLAPTPSERYSSAQGDALDDMEESEDLRRIQEAARILHLQQIAERALPPTETFTIHSQEDLPPLEPLTPRPGQASSSSAQAPTRGRTTQSTNRGRSESQVRTPPLSIEPGARSPSFEIKQVPDNDNNIKRWRKKPTNYIIHQINLILNSRRIKTPLHEFNP